MEQDIIHYYGIDSNDRQRQKDAAWMTIAHTISLLSTTPSRNVGACLVKDNIILTTGYNGVPRGVSNECPRCSNPETKSGKNLDACICVHAEVNCIIQAARKGTNVEGSTLYCTTKPCLNCLVVLINAGVSVVIYDEEYDVQYPDFLTEKIDIVKYDLGQ